ncbi:putative uncharacterized protein DDB_G0277255 [Phymastichus coffea]|uniref:putative uncharacterized protein DDB_G0277255 n=1 Tax=Phymastichus coffea TaxID=108790 RepID=UPI00273C4608|nr:putative uncharacterized protein DDB_G0277255 [Phymastichus coffea]
MNKRSSSKHSGGLNPEIVSAADMDRKMLAMKAKLMKVPAPSKTSFGPNVCRRSSSQGMKTPNTQQKTQTIAHTHSLNTPQTGQLKHSYQTYTRNVHQKAFSKKQGHTKTKKQTQSSTLIHTQLTQPEHTPITQRQRRSQTFTPELTSRLLPPSTILSSSEFIMDVNSMAVNSKMLDKPGKEEFAWAITKALKSSKEKANRKLKRQREDQREDIRQPPRRRHRDNYNYNFNDNGNNYGNSNDNNNDNDLNYNCNNSTDNNNDDDDNNDNNDNNLNKTLYDIEFADEESELQYRGLLYK